MATIKRTYFGGSEEIDFDHFAEYIIQNTQEAIDIAGRMLSGDDPYSFNEPYTGAEPEFYEEFEVLDHAGLTAQVAKAQEEYA